MARPRKDSSELLNQANITKEEKNIETKVENNIEVKDVQQSGPSYNELLEIVKSLSQEINALKNSSTNVNVGNYSVSNNDKTDKILEMLANKKTDREVVIVHNCELLGGLSTHIELLNMVIDFHGLGESRVLSWQQFEECVSKYRSFFDRQIILLSDEYAELASTYNLPMTKRSSKQILTHELINRLPSMTVRELEDTYMSLTDQDREFMLSYWIGKCYERANGFYDRYKIEILNNVSGRQAFDNILALMNGDFRNDQ